MKIAALQMRCLNGDTGANLARIATAAREAAGKGANLLITPELSVTGYGAAQAFPSIASPARGEVTAQLDAISRKSGVAIISGFAERDGDFIYNSAYFTDGNGKCAVYRKSHLYGDYERAWFKPEKPGLVMVELGGLRLAMLICYDVEFPENVRRVALAGADIVIVPTATQKGTAADFIAAHIVPVRAFESQVFVAYVNHCGSDGLFSYAGQSCIAAPDGIIVSKAPASGEALIFAEVTREHVSKSREENTYLLDVVSTG